MTVTLSSEKSPRILVIRRDNIGDLVCTTPLITALRRRLPNSWIGALVNSYNAPVLDGNPDLDAVFVYTKAKHRGGESLAGVLWRRLMMMKALRGMHFDDVLIATPMPQPRTVRLAACLRPKQIIGFSSDITPARGHESSLKLRFGDGRGGPHGLDIALPPTTTSLSEAEDVFRLAALYGIEGPPPPCRVIAPAGAAKRPDFTIALHISARKSSQRWPAERFVELMRDLHARHGARFVLLWSPGAADNPLHPGDDDKARAIVEAVEALEPGFPLNAAPTGTLPQLIGVLAGCHAMICADGGAMHLAAGLGLPIVCLFGNSGAARWRPWGVPYRLLQKPSLDVSDISVEEVAAAFGELLPEMRRKEC